MSAGGVYFKLGPVDPAFIWTRCLFGVRRLIEKIRNLKNKPKTAKLRRILVTQRLQAFSYFSVEISVKNLRAFLVLKLSCYLFQWKVYFGGDVSLPFSKLQMQKKETLFRGTSPYTPLQGAPPPFVWVGISYELF